MSNLKNSPQRSLFSDLCTACLPLWYCLKNEITLQQDNWYQDEEHVRLISLMLNTGLSDSSFISHQIRPTLMILVPSLPSFILLPSDRNTMLNRGCCWCYISEGTYHKSKRRQNWNKQRFQLLSSMCRGEHVVDVFPHTLRTWEDVKPIFFSTWVL